MKNSNSRIRLTNELQETLQVVCILYMLIERKFVIDSEFSGANRALKMIIQRHENEYWTVENKAFYLTVKGELLWENWRARWWDFIINYDIYSAVDLKTGSFADFGEDLDAIDENQDPIWEDLRIAICMRKIEIAEQEKKKTTLNPCSVAFLGLLSQGRLDQSKEWQFDIAFDSIFWNEIENVVNASVIPQDLAYDGVEYQKVIDDIIIQGMSQARSRWDVGDHFEGHLVEDAYVPSYGFQNEEDILEEYSDEVAIKEPKYYCYQPYWNWVNGAEAIGVIGLCWALS